MDAVATVCSTQWNSDIYDDGDIVFGVRRSHQRIQWMQYAVE